jgi:catechol 2,3-dioxygenase-like lactoylglutathione lyase family enzyme
MIKGFFHTGFVVQDMERMIAFYRDGLGLQLRSDSVMKGEVIAQINGLPDIEVRVVFFGREGDPHTLELAQYINPASDREVHSARNDFGASHLCFYVDDIEELYKRLKDNGLSFINRPLERALAGGVTIKQAHARDPEGNWLEFIKRPGQS